MNNIKNKEAINFLYNSILNKKIFSKLPEIISTDYTNSFGEKGVKGFQKSILELANAFPDAQWKAEEVIAENDKVVVKQKFTGTHKNQFQNIQPTGKTVSVDGAATYEFKNRKIIHSRIQTDRLVFLQQLGVLPADLSTVSDKNETWNAVYFIDKFLVPKNSNAEFVQRMNYNRNFIKNLPGFIKDDVYQQEDKDGSFSIITIAAWQSQSHLDSAKQAVQQEYQRIGFNPLEFYKRLNITMDRGVYEKPEE